MYVPESGVSLLLESLGVVCDSSESATATILRSLCCVPLGNDEVVVVEGVDVNTGWTIDEKWLVSLCDMLDDSTTESVYQWIYHNIIMSTVA